MAYRFRDHTAKQKKRAEEFQYIESVMADLFEALRIDLTKQPLARMVVFSVPNTELKALHLFFESLLSKLTSPLYRKSSFC